MLSRSWRISAAAVALPLLAAACGDAASAPPEDIAVIRPGGDPEPWESIPPDSLYGATAGEVMRLTPVVLDVAWLPPGWDGIRIAAISDLHIGLWEGNERVATEAVRRAIASEADLVVLLGDYVSSRQDTAALARVLAPLEGRQAVAVLGDRDVRSDSLEMAVTRTLSDAGVRVLKNDAVSINRNGSSGLVAGVDPEIAQEGWGSQEYVLATLGGGARTPLLLTHMAPLAARAPEDRFSAVLAGNTFCGPLEVPGTPRLSWLREEALPGAAVEGVERIFEVEGALMFVTCGVGYSFMPVRFGGQPEVALVTLRRIQGPDEDEEADTTDAAADTVVSAEPADTSG